MQQISEFEDLKTKSGKNNSQCLYFTVVKGNSFQQVCCTDSDPILYTLFGLSIFLCSRQLLVLKTQRKGKGLSQVCPSQESYLVLQWPSKFENLSMRHLLKKIS